MRFLYCACAVSYMLNDWTAVDQTAAIEYIKSCITYEGGISLVPGNLPYNASSVYTYIL